MRIGQPTPAGVPSSEQPSEGPPPAPPNIHNLLTAAKGGGFLAGGRFFEFGARLVIAVLLARFLGAEDYGLYVLALSAAALFAGIALLGLDDAMVRYVAILSGKSDRPGLLGTLQMGFGVPVVSGVVMGGVLFVGAAPIAEGLFDAPRLASLLRLLAFVVPLLTVSNVLAGTARGFKRMDYAALGENVIQSVVKVVLLAGLALVDRLDLVAAVVVFAIADLASSVTLVALLRRKIPVGSARRDVREVFSFAVPLWLSGLLRQFRGNIEIVLLGALSAVASVGVFSVVARVNLVGHVFLAAMTVAVKPILAQLHDRGDRQGLSQIYRTATRWTLMLNVPFFLVTVLYPAAILSVFGESFTAGASALVVLAFAELANAGTGICRAMIDMTGHTRVKLANAVIFTALLLGSSALLIPRWGVLGAAVATLIAMAMVNLLAVLQVWFLERLIPFDRTFLKAAVAGAGALATGWMMARALPGGTDLVAAALQGTVVLSVYAGLTLLLHLAPEDRLVLERVHFRAGSMIGRGRDLLAAAVGRPR